MEIPDKNDGYFISGRQMAEYAMQSGMLFSPLTRQTPAGRGLWPEGFPPGIETGSRLGRPVSNRGAERRARAR
jgi:hypothetical protein